MRLRAYVDGFNLYFGIRSKFGRRYHWLDLHGLVDAYREVDQTIAGVRYFTAPVRGEPEAHERQQAYLRALEAHGGVDIDRATFQKKQRRCRECGSSWRVYEEKQTDVHLSVALVEDAAQDELDVALLISGDSDMVPGVRAAKRLRPQLRVIVLSPPGRQSRALIAEADGHLAVARTELASAQLPDPVTRERGSPIHRPGHWR